MPAQKETAEQITKWLAEEWGRCFSTVIESMADQKPIVTCDGAARAFAATEGSLNSEQEFSLGPQCRIRISVPELVWREAGTRVLRAAGIEEVGRDDALGTFHEVLSQTFSGIAQALTSRLGNEVTCGARSDVDTLADDTMGLSLAFNLPDAELGDYPVFFSVASELLEQLGETAEPEASTPAKVSEPPVGQPSSISKTFDLLLGVHLPVAVSFGKTSLMVKEVLKLTTGSIIELNRAVTEPVDIIVNNCIIARGDVVVVAGNYGVRVKEIVSREQRYQTGLRPAMTHRAE